MFKRSSISAFLGAISTAALVNKQPKRRPSPHENAIRSSKKSASAERGQPVCWSRSNRRELTVAM